jgi:hypothetical protein
MYYSTLHYRNRLSILDDADGSPAVSEQGCGIWGLPSGYPELAVPKEIPYLFFPGLFYLSAHLSAV